MLKRLFDIIFSAFGLILLLPLFVIIAVLLKLESKGPVFYKQIRVGKNNLDFYIYKFRTMYVGADKKGLLTIGNRDPRVTKLGYYFRKYKLDEFPQFINVLIGDMSFVGPRPEVRKYVNLYSEDDLIILSMKPGITDYASIMFRDEVEILNKAENPEKLYIETIMPKKMAINKKYVHNNNIIVDLKIVVKTILTMFT